MSAKEVLKGRMKTMVVIPRGIGIYFLIKDGVIVYIGQSKKVFSRIEAHRDDPKKDFDTACYFECKEEELDAFEVSLIRAFWPKYNTVHNPAYIPFNYRKQKKSEADLAEAICKRLAAGKFGPMTIKAFASMTYELPDSNMELISGSPLRP